MKVAVCGAGSVGMAVATDLLAHNHQVRVLEKDPEVVDQRKATLPGVEWATVDACEVSSLQAAGLAEMDVVVAATGDDEDNLVISLLSKQEFAVPRVIARVNNASNQWLFNESWGVDIPVSTPELYTSLVEEAVSIGSLVHLFNFNSGQAHLLEVTLAENASSNGQAIADLKMPRDSRIVAVVRRGHLVQPEGDTVLAAGDEVVVLASVDSETQVEKLLCG